MVPNPIPSIIDFSGGIGAQLFFNGVYICIYEGLYLINQWRQTYEEKEKLLKLQWQSRFDLLKNQINPHFLFNSLNTLSALISENPKKAETFVDEMSNKHNIISEKKPLIIQISINKDDELVIQNNIQKKTVIALSNRVGLVNIAEKYGLLTNRKMQILDDDENFIIILPLIAPIEKSQ